MRTCAFGCWYGKAGLYVWGSLMSNTGKKQSVLDYVDLFEPAARAVLDRHPQLGAVLTKDTKEKRIRLLIPAQSESGFDAGITCESYALYPFADKLVEWWECLPRASSDSAVEHACLSCLGLLRTLLSADARLRLAYRGGHLCALTLEVRDLEGWKRRKKQRLFRLPFGKKREVVLQNTHLPARHPFTGLSRTEWGTYS